jgi:hypothetical protein
MRNNAQELIAHCCAMQTAWVRVYTGCCPKAFVISPKAKRLCCNAGFSLLCHFERSEKSDLRKQVILSMPKDLI